MAVGRSGNVIVIPSYNRLAWYTKDSGATINYLPSPFNALDGSGTSGWDFSGNGFWFSRYLVTYDATGGYFYVFNYAPTPTPRIRRVCGARPMAIHGNRCTQRARS